MVLTRTIVVKKGFADVVVEKFSKPGLVEKYEGFIDHNVLVKRGKRSEETEEILIMIRWESEEAWKKWETSPEHIQMHRDGRGKSTPEYVISSDHASYNLKSVRTPVKSESTITS